jgi:hypothetical protein
VRNAVDRPGQLADAQEQLAADPHLNSLGVAPQSLGEAAADLLVVQGAGEGLQAGVGVVQVPAQAHRVGGALADQVLAMVDQELQLTQLRVVAGVRQVRLPQGRPGDGQSVDRVGLPVGAGSLASMGAQPGPDPQDRLAAGQQEALQATVDVAAVLQGKAGLGVGLGELIRPGE